MLRSSVLCTLLACLSLGSGVVCVAEDYNTAFDRARKEFDAGHWQASFEWYQRAISANPNAYASHANIALVLRNLGRTEEAIVEAEKARQIQPDQPLPLTLLCDLHKHLGHFDEALRFCELFLQEFPKDEQAKQARELVDVLKMERLKAHQIASESTEADYFAAATYDVVTKWPLEKFPLKVFIPADSEAAAVPKYRSEYGNALRTAFEEWQKQSGGKVTFDFVTNSDGSDIECGWTNDPAHIMPGEAGQTLQLFYEDGSLQHARILMLTEGPTFTNEVKLASLHEIGHALGLRGHSSHPDDVMFFSSARRDVVPKLSERDINTLAHLYRPDIKPAKDFHQLPGGTNKFALNNEGLRLVDSHEYQKALEIFKAILKLEPKNSMARINVALCYFNISEAEAHQGRLKQAAADLRTALEYEDDKSSRITILRTLAMVYGKINMTAEAKAAELEANKLAGASNAGGASK